MEKELKEHTSAIQSYQNVFNTKDGEIVLKDLAKVSGFMASSFDVSPHVMAYNEGARQIFLRIITTLGIDTVKMIEMVKKEEEESNYMED